MKLSSLLTTLFVGLKLTGYITWPWLWVVSPLWIHLLIVFGILLLAAIVETIADLKTH